MLINDLYFNNNPQYVGGTTTTPANKPNSA